MLQKRMHHLFDSCSAPGHCFYPDVSWCHTLLTLDPQFACVINSVIHLIKHCNHCSTVRWFSTCTFVSFLPLGLVALLFSWRVHFRLSQFSFVINCGFLWCSILGNVPYDPLPHLRKGRHMHHQHQVLNSPCAAFQLTSSEVRRKHPVYGMCMEKLWFCPYA